MSKIFTTAENRSWQRTLPGKKCSACIAIVHESTVLMVKAGYKHDWTFPGGVVDTGESPLTAALRETKEETGLALLPDGVAFLTVVYTPPDNGFMDRLNFVFYTKAVSKAADLSLQQEEIEAAEWVKFGLVAERAGQRGSYRIIQRMLDGGNLRGEYVEVAVP